MACVCAESEIVFRPNCRCMLIALSSMAKPMPRMRQSLSTAIRPILPFASNRAQAIGLSLIHISLNSDCEAYKQNRVPELPTPKPRTVIPEKSTTMLILLQGDEVMLEKRPPTGIWGGLWSFPEIETIDNNDYESLVHSRFDIVVHASTVFPTLSHTCLLYTSRCV